MADHARWWEYYYVRYFVGTAFAIPLLIAITQKNPWQTVLGMLPTQAWLTAGAVAVGGLAFCYIASTPILVLHAMRWRIPSTALTYKLVLAVIGMLALIAAITFVILSPETTNSAHPQSDAVPPKTSLALLMPYLVVVIAQGALLTYGVWRKAQSATPVTQSQTPVTQSQQNGSPHIDGIVEFYRNIAGARAKAFERQADPRTPRAEYIESYRHLREHGNAVLILIAEVIFALALMTASGFMTAILIVFVWVLPAAIVWPLATWLEIELNSIS